VLSITLRQPSEILRFTQDDSEKCHSERNEESPPIKNAFCIAVISKLRKRSSLLIDRHKELFRR
jgi:hypothetical protein